MKRTVTLRMKFVGALILIMALLWVANLFWSHQAQEEAMKDELLEQSRSLSSLMTSVWDFASINKDEINTSASGEYDYKGLHCSLVGKAVGKLFSKSSDYTFHFVNSAPRNPNALPDGFEAEALSVFSAGSSKEYYSFTEHENRPVFRYTYAMVVNKNCLECHGEPQGEIDISGFPKEGWRVGDVAGAGSIIIPTEIPRTNMTSNLIQNATFFGVIILASALFIYFALSRLILSPMRRLQVGFRTVGKGGMDYRLEDTQGSIYATREIASVFYSFNNMTQELEELYRNLEGRVVQRTKELSEANRELELQRQHLRDVNDRLLKESRYKTDFLAMVSHELRTPLTSILAFSELLRSTLDNKDDSADKQLAKIIINSHQLLGLINDLLDSARIESGKQTVKSEVIDLYDIVGEVLSIIGPLAEEKSIVISTSNDKDVPLIESDQDLVAHVLVNLLSNAIKFTPGHGIITVHLENDSEGGAVVIHVADSGIGIPAEQQRMIFDRFVQGETETVMNRSYGGSGLGLSLCKEIVSLLGGKIYVESECGKGSIFTVELPYAMEDPAIRWSDEQSGGAERATGTSASVGAAGASVNAGPDAVDVGSDAVT